MMRNDPEVRKYIIGFDLVGEEDRYHSLAYYLDDFFRIQQYTQSNGYPNLPFYFHAGETFWNRKSHDNLYEAILLNTSRIGHGLALQYHPVLMQIVRSRKIAIEVAHSFVWIIYLFVRRLKLSVSFLDLFQVCPISNQLLRFVSDLRNHPAVVYMTNGLPVAISNDDPHVFGYSGLSYDYYEAIISWNLTLRNIKQLAMNSLLFSGLEGNEKSQQLRDWTTRWKSWIEWVLSQFSTESFDNKAKLN
jgi:adenosine deaminase CECR1